MKISFKKKPRIIQLTTLCRYGRFGNQLFKYAVAKKYALLNRATLEVPADWIGRKLFYIDDPAPTEGMPRVDFKNLVYDPIKPMRVDVCGHPRLQLHMNILSKKEVGEWFRFRPEWAERYSKKKDHYVAAHMRQGDYITTVSDTYCLISEHSYTSAIQKFGYDQKDVIWVKENTPEVDPVATEAGFDFLPDFFTLMQADVIFRANSTFSWWAAALSNAKVYSPLVKDMVGPNDVDFVSGNHAKMLSSDDDQKLPE